MRLLKPAPGEIVDRQTILELKMKYAQGYEEPKMFEGTGIEEHANQARVTIEGISKVDIKPFAEEHEALQVYMEKHYFPNIAPFKHHQKAYDEFYAELLEVNGQLWKLEDQARLLAKAPNRFLEAAAVEATDVLFSITATNDRRANLVKQINLIWFITTQEKLY